jgi:hypothetical protein
MLILCYWTILFLLALIEDVFVLMPISPIIQFKIYASLIIWYFSHTLVFLLVNIKLLKLLKRIYSFVILLVYRISILLYLWSMIDLDRNLFVFHLMVHQVLLHLIKLRIGLIISFTNTRCIVIARYIWSWSIFMQGILKNVAFIPVIISRRCNIRLCDWFFCKELLQAIIF